MRCTNDQDVRVGNSSHNDRAGNVVESESGREKLFLSFCAQARLLPVLRRLAVSY